LVTARGFCRTNALSVAKSKGSAITALNEI